MRFENPQSKIRDPKSILAAVASSVDGQGMATIGGDATAADANTNSRTLVCVQ